MPVLSRSFHGARCGAVTPRRKEERLNPPPLIPATFKANATTRQRGRERDRKIKPSDKKSKSPPLIPFRRAGPNTPTLRANPYPEVTDPICRFPLPTFFYRLEAVHLGDLMRISVRASASVLKRHPPTGFSRAKTPDDHGP